MNTIPRQTYGNAPLAKKNRHDVTLFYHIGKDYPYPYPMYLTLLGDFVLESINFYFIPLK
uniref:Uncharacterized protein n=1 Tax=Oryza brachyantha TaxID=4533 RepID=J3NDL6_ORYBR